MKTLLINPTRTGVDSYITPPLHLISIATAIIAAGHETEIIDLHYHFFRKNDKNLAKAEFEEMMISKIVDMDFDILGVGSIVGGYPCTKQLVKALKNVRPDVPVIIGVGMAISLKNLWEERTDVDFLVESDGDIPIEKFLESWPNKEQLGSIPGLYTRSDGKFIASTPDLPRNLDYLSFPDWDLLPYFEDYFSIQKEWVNLTLPPELNLGDDDRVMQIVTTRGCPYHCIFCYHVNSLHRSHSPEYVVNLIRHLQEKYGVTYLFTWDDLIMTNVKWLESLCDAIIEDGVKVKIFTGGGKPNLVTRNLLRKMYQAGFMRVSYGIESGSQKILDLMKKKHTVEQNSNAVKMAIEEKLYAHMNMIIGMPGEDSQTLKETHEFLITLAKEGYISSKNVSFSYATGYPGTELWDWMVDQKLVGDTEEYLVNQTGLIDYKYNLCGQNVNSLKFWRSLTILKLDYFYAKAHEGTFTALAKAMSRVLRKAFSIISLKG